MTGSIRESATIGLARRWTPFLWLAVLLTWVALLFVTDQPAWPLAVWIAITIGPLTLLHAHGDKERSADGMTKTQRRLE